jgi:hypothetical protein
MTNFELGKLAEKFGIDDIVSKTRHEVIQEMLDILINTNYSISKAKSLTKDKLFEFADNLGIEVQDEILKKDLFEQLKQVVDASFTEEE